jgi:ribose transport system ATP-binding protein
VGLTLTSTVSDNLTLPNLKTINKWLTHRSKEEEYANEGVTKMGVKTASIDTIIGTLSGGNQQKVVLSRWLMMNPKVLIVDEPTRGIDVGAKAEIYHQLRTLADQGIGIWMISSDMEEILRMSDRVVVMHEGKISGELDGESATEEQIMALAVGNTNATNQQNGVSQS